MQLGKLASRGLVSAIAPCQLVHITDQLTQRCFLVDTGAAYSVFPHSSSSFPSGPALSGAAGQPIRCWGEQQRHLYFGGQGFSWPFLLAAVQFPIIGVDFLCHFGLLVGPAANQLVDRHTLQVFKSSASPTATPVSASIIFPPAGQLDKQSLPSPHRPLRSSNDSTTPHVKVPSGSCEVVLQAAICGLSSEAGHLSVNGLLAEFPDVVNAAQSLPAVRHDVVHFICRSGPPRASRFRRLEGAKLEATRKEFEAMERGGH